MPHHTAQPDAVEPHVRIPLSVLRSRGYRSLRAAADHRVYAWLRKYADADGGSCYPSLARLAEDAGVPRTGLPRIIQRLIRAGLVRKIAKGGGRGRTTRYILTADPDSSARATVYSAESVARALLIAPPKQSRGGCENSSAGDAQTVAPARPDQSRDQSRDQQQPASADPVAEALRRVAPGVGATRTIREALAGVPADDLPATIADALRLGSAGESAPAAVRAQAIAGHAAAAYAEVRRRRDEAAQAEASRAAAPPAPRPVRLPAEERLALVEELRAKTARPAAEPAEVAA